MALSLLLTILKAILVIPWRYESVLCIIFQVILVAMALSVLFKKVENEEEEEMSMDEEDLVLQQDEEWLQDQKNLGM